MEGNAEENESPSRPPLPQRLYPMPVLGLPPLPRLVSPSTARQTVLLLLMMMMMMALLQAVWVVQCRHQAWPPPTTMRAAYEGN